MDNLIHLETISYYKQNVDKMASQYLRVDVSDLQRVLRQWIPLDVNILEIGCGCGIDAFFMANLTAKIKDTNASKTVRSNLDSLIYSSREISFGLY